MTERREIKQRSQAVWDRVRDAYLAGEPAASVARRFDVGLGNLRYRANQQGWTRRAAMARAEAEEAVEAARFAGRADPLVEEPYPAPSADAGLSASPPIADPGTAARMAVARASALIAAGRAAEATALLKAAETLGRLTAEVAPPAEPEPEPEPTPEEVAAFEARVRAQWEAYHADVRAEADTLARAMLEGTDPGHIHSLHAHRWRAETLGPEVGRADYEQARQFSTSPRDWDEKGELLPEDGHDDRNWEWDRPRLMWVARGGSLDD